MPTDIKYQKKPKRGGLISKLKAKARGDIKTPIYGQSPSRHKQMGKVGGGKRGK
jgi:hypothetical protein